MRIDSKVIPDNILRRINPIERKQFGKAGLTREECAQRALAKRERDMHNVFEDWLKLKGIPYDHSRMDKKTTQQCGVPDFLVIWKQKVCPIEFKMPGNNPSPEQQDFIERLNATGTTTYICTAAYEAIEITKRELGV